MQILLVEDDVDIANLVQLHLGDLGYQVTRVEDGPLGLKQALENEFDLVILDIMLPGMDGLEVCKRIRQENRFLPILMLTARSEELDKVLGLELGADDYLTKPFSIRELIARIKAIFRRIDTERQKNESGEEPQKWIYGGLVIYPQKRKVFLDDDPVELTAKEFDLLALFARNPGRAYSRQVLLDQVWGYQFNGYEHTVNSHINRLRNKIEPDPAKPVFIKTVWGVGYRFCELEEI